MVKYDKEIKAYALRNAIEFGSADAGKILPKLFQHGLKKEEIAGIMPEIKKIVGEINAMSLEDRKLLFANYEGIVKTHEEDKEHELPELPGITNAREKSPISAASISPGNYKTSRSKKQSFAVGVKPVFRMAPFPSGALHIGNAKTYILNALYAEKYKGKLLLVMDDTIGSAEKQVEKDSYGLIEDAFKWLGIKYSGKIIYKSDRLKIYYKYAEELIEKGHAYVCHCSQEELKKNREEGKECSCRVLPKKIQVSNWKKMFKEKEGSAVLRIKTDMAHSNPAFRDRVLFKISEREHPRVGKKFRVWPTLDMCWAIDDHLLKITHIIRGSDLMMESEMEKYIWDIFKWKHPAITHAGMVNIGGVKLSKSKAQKEVKSGEFIGWDDPRTWSVQSLRRRGIKANAIIKFIKEIGLNRHDITVPIDNLYSINRKMIDASSNRYSFVTNPVKLEISNKPEWKEIEVPVHPDKNEKRKVQIGEIYISGEDYKNLEGKEIRLLHLYNIKLGQECEFIDVDNKNIQKINWVSGEFVLARVFMPGGVWAEGIAEPFVKNLKKGEVVQFERFGFVRAEGKKSENGKEIYEFWFAHK